jgi:integrase
MTMFEDMDKGELGRLFQEFVLEKLGQKGEKVRLRDLWVKYEAYATTPTDGGRPRIKSWKTHGHIWAKHVLPFWGDLTWDQCTLAKADEYRTHRRSMISERTKKLIKAASSNRELRGVQACLSWSVKRGLIPRNPLTGLQDEREIHDRDFAITQEQFLAIVEKARPFLQHFLVVLYETGCRRDEIRMLEWSEVDLAAGVIRLPWHRTKAKRDRVITLSTAAMITLERIPAFKDVPYVFVNPVTGKGPITKSTLCDWFVEARTAAKVTGPKGQPVWLHTLRHSWATDMATMGLNIPTLMQMGGWADKKMMDKYTNITERHTGAARTQMDERSIAITRALHGERTGPKGMRLVPGTKAAKKDEQE